MTPSGLPARAAGVRAAALGLVLFLLAGCAVEAPPAAGPSATHAAASSPASVPASSATTAPSRRATLAAPDLPYTGPDLLAAMLGSPRPGGVPDALETDAVAGEIAEHLWTWDGRPWRTLTVSGACGPDACSLDVAGAPEGAVSGDDLYSFAVDPASGAVDLIATDLHGFPTSLERELDAAAREALDAGVLEGLSLVAARWLPPPETDRYWLAYRSGGEEGSPRLDVLLDVGSGRVVRVEGED